MDIQEAIKHCRDVAAGATEQGKCPECAADHKQLAEWLEELVAYRATKLPPDDLNATFNKGTFLRLAARVLDTTPERLQELAQADRAGRLAVPDFIQTPWIIKQFWTSGSVRTKSLASHRKTLTASGGLFLPRRQGSFAKS